MKSEPVRRIVRTLLSVVMLSASPAAQPAATVSDRVRDAILAQEGGWQLESPRVEEHMFSHGWVHGAERLSIVYDEQSSVAEATAWLDVKPYQVQAGGGEPWPGVGDQALIWRGVKTTGEATIYFRKNKGTVVLLAPSVEVATRMAHLIAGQIY